MDRTFPASRAAGLNRLAAFTPRMARAYAAGRNIDPGPDEEGATAGLSPYLRRRMITEAEVVAAAHDAHGPDATEKFVQEIFWRTYFKGYLETRPSVWSDYQRLVEAGRHRLAAEPGFRLAFEDACAGRTGIECFDDWARELAATNWLHNHTRMWFASIWTFTLRLPWALGADLFLRQLIDGDPASNTLSWRWVAGLHTRGRAYAARAENIRRCTNGRYDPADLDESPVALEEPDSPAPAPLPAPDAPPASEVALLLHLDDLQPESLPLGPARVVRLAGLVAHAPGAVARVRHFDAAAMEDALACAQARFGCDVVPYTQGWADDLPVVTAWAPVGPSAAALPSCLRIRRTWDSSAWPRATRGYFQVRAAIPRILTDVQLS